jgi:fibro-slime domain-containing protein
MSQKCISSPCLLMALAGIAFTAMLYDFSSPRTARAGYAAVSAPDGLPDILTFTAVIRDFKSASEKGGHPDFESFGHSDASIGLVDAALDSEGKPVFADSYGQDGCGNFKNAAGQRILPSMASKNLGDSVGTLTKSSAKQLTSGDAFKQWYRTDASVNIAKAVPLKLNRVTGTNRYVFDSAVDEPYKSRGGFFPINGDLFGNYSSTGKNFHFTTEVDCKFVFNKADNAVFTFTGDDDLWVFIDGKLVMDLGGLHSKREQTLEINRLGWLTDGQPHTLKIFHAERHTTESNFRIETSLQLVPAPLPPTSGLSD